MKEALSIIRVCTLGLLLFVLPAACRKSPEQKPENLYEDFNHLDEEECLRAQEKYAALLDEAIKEKIVERDALLAQLRGKSEHADLLQIAILDLESEITRLSLQRQKIKDTRCDKPETIEAEDEGEK